MSSNSFKRRALKSVGLVAWVVSGFFLAQVFVGLVVAGLTVLGVPLASVNEVLFNTAANVLIYAVAIAVVGGVPWLVWRRGLTLKSVGLQRLPKWSELLLPPAGMVAYLVLTMVIAALAMVFLPFVDYQQVQQTGFSQLSSQLEYILAFFSLVIIAPLAEEVLFRGYLFGKLRDLLPTWLAVLVTSLLFGAVHLQWNVGLDVFALSIVLCLLRVYSGSLWPSILLHMMKNGTAFYFLFINPIVAVTIGS